jgi:hypothetical protein
MRRVSTLMLVAVAILAAAGLGYAAGQDQDDGRGDAASISDDIGVDLDVMPWGRIDACPTHSNPGSPPTSHCPTVGQMEIEILTLDPAEQPDLDIPDPRAWCREFLEGAGSAANRTAATASPSTTPRRPSIPKCRPASDLPATSGRMDSSPVDLSAEVRGSCRVRGSEVSTTDLAETHQVGAAHLAEEGERRLHVGPRARRPARSAWAASSSASGARLSARC